MMRKMTTAGRVVALALTWDGARWPVRGLQPKARAFLGGSGAVPSSKAMAKLLAQNAVWELRVCWVPRLKGGADVLAEPFATSDGLRVAFRLVKTVRLGDMLGVVYRKTTKNS